MIRSILSVLAGYLASMILTASFYHLFIKDSGTPYGPSSTAFLLMMIANVIYCFIGGVITASIAAQNRIRHAMYLGVVMIILGILHLFLVESKAPMSFQIIALVLALPAAWFGGFLREFLRK